MNNFDYLITIEKKIFDIYNSILKREFNNKKNDFITHDLWIQLKKYVEEENRLLDSLVCYEDDDEYEDDKGSDLVVYQTINKENEIIQRASEIDDISFSALNNVKEKEEFLIELRIMKKFDNRNTNRRIHLSNNLSLQEYMTIISNVLINELETNKIKNYDKIIKLINDPVLKYELLSNKYSIMFCNDISKFVYDSMCNRDYLQIYNYDPKLINAQCNQEVKERLNDIFSIIYGQLTDQEITHDIECQIDLYSFICELQSILDLCDEKTFEEIYFELYKKVLNRNNIDNTIIANEIKRLLNKKMEQFKGVKYEKRRK